MNRLRMLVGGLVVTAAAATYGSSGMADETKAEPGFVSLFNGKDLSGWKFGRNGKDDLAGQTATPNGRFEVKDGVIVANKGKGIMELFTTKDYNQDFHLKLQFRAAPRSDSGVYIRGKQLQVRDYPALGPYKPKSFRSGEWNDLDIVVTGTSALCKCNGEVLEKAFQVPAKGGIGLQAETGMFEFRDVRVKE